MMDISKVTSPTDWPKNLPEIGTLDNLLRCQICRGYFETCMTTSCSHNFCSRCVRSYMTVNAKCPVCFKETAEPSLRKNILVDELVAVFHELRRNHPDLINKSNLLGVTRDNSQDEIKMRMDTNIPNEKNVSSKALGVIEVVNLSDEEKGQISSSSGMTKTNAEINSTSTTYLPKVVYNLMTLPKLRSKLKEHGLSMKGDKKRLISRHQRFVVLYNANCDSSSPLSVSDILLQLEQEECESVNKNDSELMTLTRNMSQDVVDTKLMEYRKRHKTHFDELIRNVKSRKQ